MSKVMFSLPNTLIDRMKAVIPAGERSHVLAELLIKEVEAREEHLYRQALQLEANKELRSEMKEWDQALFHDGLDDV